MTTIQDTLRSFGITRCYKGYNHMVYAVQLVMEDESRLEAITKEIYEETAEHFGCTTVQLDDQLKKHTGRNMASFVREVRLQEDCIILYQTISYSVPKDSPLIAYGHYDTCVDEIDQDSHTHEHLQEKKHADMVSHDLWEETC